MKRFLLWVVGVILGVAVLLGAVMTVSYSFTGEGSRPAADTQFGVGGKNGTTRRRASWDRSNPER